ncbi:MAG: TetR/AcrR family transcriptional regulator [bacterium]|nr:TetR/AcrR family transcriptional regulator [bacterium]
MPRTRDPIEHDATKAQIKAVARAQMAALGTAGLSLRAIAREMDVTAPALYRYYPCLDDLITALIVDAFNHLADWLEAADEAIPARDDYRARLIAVCLAYRDWAFSHPTDFQLIYGNPIPGYDAPDDVTVPAAVRTNVALTQVLVEAHRAGKYRLPDVPLPETVRETADRIGAAYQLSGDLVDAGIALWELVHGSVFLEMFGHTPPTVGDVQAHLVRLIGLHFPIDP